MNIRASVNSVKWLFGQM